MNFVLPGDIDDPANPSGGNVYDRRIADLLEIKEFAVPGSWPHPAKADLDALASVLSGLGEGAVVLIDGLVASAAPEVLAPQAKRLNLVILMHMPLETASEGIVLRAAQAVVTTSEWTRDLLLDRYPLDPGRVHVAIPGAQPMPLTPFTAGGHGLLCVGAITVHKGLNVLAEALSTLDDLTWSCTCVGSVTREPDFANRLMSGGPARMRFTGPLTGAALDAAYTGADLLVLASRGETYGMVVTEALARGIPVVATDIQGVPEALGFAPDGSRPGILVPPGDAAALAMTLRSWLTDSALRQRLRLSARERRTTLTGWGESADRIAKVLHGLRSDLP